MNPLPFKLQALRQAKKVYFFWQIYYAGASYTLPSKAPYISYTISVTAARIKPLVRFPLMVLMPAWKYMFSEYLSEHTGSDVDLMNFGHSGCQSRSAAEVLIRRGEVIYLTSKCVRLQNGGPRNLRLFRESGSKPKLQLCNVSWQLSTPLATCLRTSANVFAVIINKPKISMCGAARQSRVTETWVASSKMYKDFPFFISCAAGSNRWFPNRELIQGTDHFLPQ